MSLFYSDNVFLFLLDARRHLFLLFRRTTVRLYSLFVLLVWLYLCQTNEQCG